MEEEKIIKSLIYSEEFEEFYELRVSVSKDEYRSVLFAVDKNSFMESMKILILNSFLKKGTKQYKSEIKLAERLLKKYLED